MIGRAWRITLLLAAAGCGEGDDVSLTRAAVTGGAVDPATAAVVAIVPVVPTCGEPSAAMPVVCTGTLIAPRVVLTAAHCVESAANAQVLAVVFADDVAHAMPGALIRAVDGRVHPAWRPGLGVHDLGALVLADDAPVAPLALAEAPPALADLVRVVGFGLDEQAALGVRRAGTARVSALDDNTFSITAAPAMTCGGDSGGPVLSRDERIVGVASFGDVACTTGSNMRVDRDAAFVTAIVDDVGRAPARPAFDAAGDACAAPCRDHADCPIGMACVAGPDASATCAVAGFAAGHFGAACTGPDGDRPCLRTPDPAQACRQWLPCEPARDGGCAIGEPGAGILLALLALIGPRRRARRR